MAVEGKQCPETAHAVRTDEGARVWDAVRRSGSWSGGGLAPLRIDRRAVRDRLDDLPGWIVETLLDAFEPHALAAIRAAEAKRKPRGDATPSPGRRTRRRARPGGETEA